MSILKLIILISFLFRSSFAYKVDYTDFYKNAEKIEHDLKNSKIIKIEKMIDFLSKEDSADLFTGENEVFVIYFANGLKGVFREEVKTNCPYDNRSRNADILAYRLAKETKLNKVPVTILKTINGMKGTLQIFIEDGKIIKTENELQKIDKIELQEKMFFDFLIGNWDNGIHNNLITPDNSLISIDYEAIFVSLYANNPENSFRLICEKGNFDITKDVSDIKIKKMTEEKFTELSLINQKKFNELSLMGCHDCDFFKIRKKAKIGQEYFLYNNKLFFSSLATLKLNIDYNHCSKNTIQKIKKIDSNMLNRIFKGLDKSFLNEDLQSSVHGRILKQKEIIIKNCKHKN